MVTSTMMQIEDFQSSSSEKVNHNSGYNDNTLDMLIGLTVQRKCQIGCGKGSIPSSIEAMTVHHASNACEV